MRWSGRTAAVLCAAACTGPLLAAPAVAAESALEKPQLVGYFSATGPKDTGTPAGTPPNLGTSADGVAPGNLGVQGQRGQEQKVSFLLFPAEPLLAGGTATRAVLTVPLASGQGNVSVAAAPEKVRACKIDETGFGGEDGADLAVAPARLCDEFSAVATASSDGTAYVFDITGLATGWTEANDGLALTVAEDAAPFQVVFSPDATLLLEYEAAAEEEGTTAPDLPSTPDVPVDTGTTSGGSSDFGGSGDTGAPDLGGFDTSSDIPAPLDGFGSGTSSDPVLAAPDLPLVEAAPGAEVAPELAAPVAVVPAASSSSEVPLTPTAGFWLATLLFGALLALVSLVMGDSAVRTTRTRPSRLDQALSARRPASSTGRLALS